MIDRIKRNARQKKWTDSHPEASKIITERYAAKESSKKKQKEWSKEWRNKNPEKNAAMKKAWYDANPEKMKAMRLVAKERSKKRREALVGKKRPAACEICKTEKVLAADHCHRTGIYRGWLCNSCNLAIGCAKDDPEILRLMIAWVGKTKDIP